MTLQEGFSQRTSKVEVVFNHSSVEYIGGTESDITTTNTTVIPTISEGEHLSVMLRNEMASVYFYLTAMMSVLSMIGCVIIILTYWLFPDLRTSGRQLLVYLSVADFLTALGNLIGIIWYALMRYKMLTESQSDALCQSHSGLTIFSSISSFFWTVCIAIHLDVCIVRRNSYFATRLVCPFHFMCWVVPGRFLINKLIFFFYRKIV